MRTPVTICALVALTAMACGDDGDADGRWRDYIRADRYTRLVIEVDFVTGQRLAGEDRIAAPLSEVLDKPDGIVVTIDDELPPNPGKAWKLRELEALMDAHDDVALEAGAIKINTLVVDGSYAEGDALGTVLGISWGGHRVVLFGDALAAACQGGQTPVPRDLLCRAVRNAVWMHEIGHLIGLVDNGLPMVSDHRDPEASHGAHDRNEACLMYWATNRGAVVQRVADAIFGGSGESPLEFDAACKADIAAVRDAPP